MDKYQLYHNIYSICSQQVRYTIAVAGKPGDGLASMQIEEIAVDLFNNGQLDEFFLTNINRKGQARLPADISTPVPVLCSPSFQKPIADTLEITSYLLERYPDLVAEQHAEATRELLQDVHALNYFALSFPDRPQVAKGFIKSIQDRLSQDGISDKYREALEYKLSVTTSEKLHGIQPDAVRANEEKARNLMEKLDSLLEDGPWLFGGGSPTVLDAHVVILIGRMQDVGRANLISSRLLKYADAAFQTPELQSVMEGRRTMVPRA